MSSIDCLAFGLYSLGADCSLQRMQRDCNLAERCNAGLRRNFIIENDRIELAFHWSFQRTIHSHDSSTFRSCLADGHRLPWTFHMISNLHISPVHSSTCRSDFVSHFKSLMPFQQLSNVSNHFNCLFLPPTPRPPACATRVHWAHKSYVMLMANAAQPYGIHQFVDVNDYL